VIDAKLLSKVLGSVPIPCVDLVVAKPPGEILLTRRTIAPYRGCWHLPGGMVRKGEKISDAARRIAMAELGISPGRLEFLGIFENIRHFRHDISHCFMVQAGNVRIRLDFQSDAFRFFGAGDRLPSRIIPFHKLMIQKYRQTYG
jgi:ADP-ribose pyrophosphatase YjhB (NUDIX family)